MKGELAWWVCGEEHLRAPRPQQERHVPGYPPPPATNPKRQVEPGEEAGARPWRQGQGLGCAAQLHPCPSDPRNGCDGRNRTCRARCRFPSRPHTHNDWFSTPLTSRARGSI